jgi:hypothetical protein
VNDGDYSGIAASGSAVAHIRFAPSSRHSKDREAKVSIAIDAPKHTSAMALDFQMPEGWQVTFISDGGEWDELNRKAKWGPFYQDLSRTVTLKARLTTSSLITSTRQRAHERPLGSVSGAVSFDGINQPITIE